MLPADAQTPDGDGFAALYTQWFYKTRMLDDRLDEQLEGSFETAWQEGSWEDRYAVLGFVYDKRKAHAFHLLVEALRGGDEGLASHAAALTFSLLVKGRRFNEDLQRALDDFERRFPAAHSLARAIRDELSDARVVGGDDAATQEHP